MITNTKTKGEVFFGLHMVEGTAEYAEPGAEPYRIYINQNTIRNMNPTFQGKPVYVDHVDGVDEDNLEAERELDGVVVRSFYNKADGRTWAEFIVFTDRAKNAIKTGWTLSNAYVPQGFAGGGENHGVSYSKEVTSGEFEHLAIVQNPRYEESVILTPEQFKSYCEEKEAEHVRLANSKKGEGKMKLNIFKRTKTKIENALDGDTVIEVSEGLKDASGKAVVKEVSMEKLLNSFATLHNMHGYANGDHLVKVGEDEMSVNDLVKKHIEMCNAEKEKEENEGEGEPGVDVENEIPEEKGIEEGLKDVDSRGGDKSLDNEEEEMSDEESAAAKKKKNAASRKSPEELAAAKRKAFALKNAASRAYDEEAPRIDLSMDKVARGRQRYGS